MTRRVKVACATITPSGSEMRKGHAAARKRLVKAGNERPRRANLRPGPRAVFTASCRCARRLRRRKQPPALRGFAGRQILRGRCRHSRRPCCRYRCSLTRRCCRAASSPRRPIDRPRISSSPSRPERATTCEGLRNAISTCSRVMPGRASPPSTASWTSSCHDSYLPRFSSTRAIGEAAQPAGNSHASGTMNSGYGKKFMAEKGTEPRWDGAAQKMLQKPDRARVTLDAART